MFPVVIGFDSYRGGEGILPEDFGNCLHIFHNFEK